MIGVVLIALYATGNLPGVSAPTPAAPAAPVSGTPTKTFVGDNPNTSGIHAWPIYSGTINSSLTKGSSSVLPTINNAGSILPGQWIATGIGSGTSYITPYTSAENPALHRYYRYRSSG